MNQTGKLMRFPGNGVQARKAFGPLVIRKRSPAKESRQCP